MIKNILFLANRKCSHSPVKRYIKISIITIIIFSSVLISNVYAEKNLTLQWDPNEDADYYVVYWGTSSGDYTMHSINIDAQETEYTATELENSTIYYFAVKAFNTFGNSSDYSDEIVCTETDGNIIEDGVDSVSEDDVINISLTPELLAEISPSTVQTRWQISLYPDFSTIELDVIKNSELSSLKVPRLILNGGTTYYWRVSIDNTKGETEGWAETKSFSTTVNIAADNNGNGVPDLQEVDSTVDLDLNGISDLDQEDMRCVVNTDNYSQIVGVKKGLNVNDIELTEFIDPQEIDETTGMPDELPSGLIGFKIVVDNPGDRAQVVVYFSDPAAEDAGWYKYDSINGWVNYTSNVAFSSDRFSVTIDLVDGGEGDADGVANGVIVDPGGLGIMSGAGHGIFAEGSEGGCFILTPEQRVAMDVDEPEADTAFTILTLLALLIVSGFFYRTEK